MENTKMSFTETNDILVSIISNISYGIIAFDFNGDITIVNQLAKNNLSLPFSLTDFSNKNINECIEDIQELNTIIQECLKKSRKAFKLDTIEHKGKFLMVNGNPILNGMILTIEDITEKKESEKSTLKALITGQEDERKRIAKEIHDGLGPMLSAVKMNLQSIQDDLGSVDENIWLKLESTYALIDNVANDMRNLSHDLMPRIVEDFGLVEAIGSLCKTLKNENTEIIFNHNIYEERFKRSIELNFYRITQELIHNALKYSRAKKINVQLIKHSNSLVLMVEDNGKGFDNKESKDFGIGLKNIETRVIAMGGILTLDSVPQIGVTATIEIII